MNTLGAIERSTLHTCNLSATNKCFLPNWLPLTKLHSEHWKLWAHIVRGKLFTNCIACHKPNPTVTKSFQSRQRDCVSRQWWSLISHSLNNTSLYQHRKLLDPDGPNSSTITDHLVWPPLHSAAFGTHPRITPQPSSSTVAPYHGSPLHTMGYLTHWWEIRNG
jgi:hypothetical protein